MEFRLLSTTAVFFGLCACARAQQPAPASGDAPTSGAAGDPSPEQRALAARAERHGLSLPIAHNALDFASEDQPYVVVSGDRILVGDDKQVGTAHEISDSNRLQRVDELFHELKAQRDQWKAEHPNQDFHGVVIFWVDATTSALVVKSVFQTAAFAGYPNGAFAVKKADRPSSIGRLNADARIPMPPGVQPPLRVDTIVLHLESHDRGAQIAWKYGNQVLRTSVAPANAAGDYAALAEREWSSYGGHRAADDPRFDQAVVHVDNAATFAKIVMIIDGLYSPKRSFGVDGEVDQVPAFNVTFAVN
jgi:hypothetical protein